MLSVVFGRPYLQHVLPVGYTLYVHSILGDDSKRMTMHEGTGRAIK
ncbi:MAG TPA: hypothetical protein H9881_12940 [Candidatus Stackebrandtia excrementipullorum]|nr:hypothetical protein [Candidatus Stackebrandtia excrementipullorum]